VYRPIIDYKKLQEKGLVTKDEFIKFSGISNNLPIVVFQGGLTKERNLENLVLAFSDLKNTANLLIIGDGPLMTRLKEIKTSLNLNNVFIKGWVNQDFLSSVLKHVSFGIIPYSLKSLLNNLYCTPNKLFEYIAHHVPICANFLPEVVTIVSGYNIGKVYQLTTSNKIAEGIKDFLNHFPSIPTQNFEKADQDFSWQTQEQKLLEIYKGLE
jgi:glycosyltransferase involved in cell wall biosynthesis